MTTCNVVEKWNGSGCSELFVRVSGWEKAESEAAEFKAELENVTKQQRETEERAKHLDGALNEIMQQLRGGREEHEKHLHDTIVKKTREFDKLRLDMEAKLSGVTKSLSENRTQLIESQAENEALNHALMVSTLNLLDLYHKINILSVHCVFSAV